MAEEAAEAPEPEKYTGGDCQYIIPEDGTAEIAGYSGITEELTIPGELDGRESDQQRGTGGQPCGGKVWKPVRLRDRPHFGYYRGLAVLTDEENGSSWSFSHPSG